MPKGPKGERRPADVIGNAVHVMRIATGQVEERTGDEGKDPAAVSLGRRGGLKGGKARAVNLSKERRSEIAKQAAKKRWSR
ncbi:RNA-binding protein [Reyranella sp.]|uniref:RNA-binding protein n=1 Tax=Reyranella sp. TaxID=1929291 RepID=UPI0025E4ECE4|nr:RNA-binding protein [Reyranella sp.]